MPNMQVSVREAQFVAAARAVLTRVGVSRTSVRAVAAEAGVPLGTLQYAFPNKELLLRAVIENVVEEVAGLLKEAAELERGLEHAIRHGLSTFWARMVAEQTMLQVVQYELVTYALRHPGLEHLARQQYDLYAGIVAEWCQEAASAAGERCAVPFSRLARVMVASVDGLVMQHVCDPKPARSAEDLAAVADMLVALASPTRVSS